MLLHAPQQAECTIDVHIVIVERDLGRLSDSFEGSKVDDIVDVGVFVKDCIQRLLVGDVKLFVLGSLATDELDAVKDFVGGVVEIVDDDHFVVMFEEGESSERANVAGATVCNVLLVYEMRNGPLRTKWTYPVTRTEPTTMVTALECVETLETWRGKGATSLYSRGSNGGPYILLTPALAGPAR